MPETVKAQLYLTTVLVLEELGYLLPCKEMGEAQRTPVLGESVRVYFDGDRRGCLQFRINGAALAEMSANMLGREEAPDPGLRRDALGEFASVLCGNLLPAMYGCTPEFDVRAPSFPTLEEPDSRGGRLAGRVEVGLDSGGRAEALLFLEDDALSR